MDQDNKNTEIISDEQMYRVLGALTDSNRELEIRKISLAMIVNIINAYLKVHSLSALELEALQTAVTQEENLIKNLSESIKNNLSIAHQENVLSVNKEIIDSTETEINEA